MVIRKARLHELVRSMQIYTFVWYLKLMLYYCAWSGVILNLISKCVIKEDLKGFFRHKDKRYHVQYSLKLLSELQVKLVKETML